MPVEKLFPDFEIRDLQTSGATIHCLRKGSGPPLLLLHGYPQTHVIWHKIANRLSETYTVILTDLRGYGDSSKPEGGPRRENYSFRAMAQDQVDVMKELGYESFFLGAHDRGARVAHRMCLDHPGAVRKVCVMDIVPTLTMYRETNQEFATKYMWWFFLIQKEPLPEHMIGADSLFFLNMHFEIQNGTPGALTDDAFAEHRRTAERQRTLTSKWMKTIRGQVGRSKFHCWLSGVEKARLASCGTYWTFGAVMPIARCKVDLSTPATILRRSSRKKC